MKKKFDNAVNGKGSSIFLLFDKARKESARKRRGEEKRPKENERGGGGGGGVWSIRKKRTTKRKIFKRNPGRRTIGQERTGTKVLLVRKTSR